MKISKDVSPGNVPRLSASPSAVSILLPARHHHSFIIISACCMRFSIVWNWRSYVGLLISLIPKRGGIMGRLPKLHDFQLGVYSCGSFSVQRWPNVQVTWYPFPSMYPSFFLSLPIHRLCHAPQRAFSAIQTIIRYSFSGTKVIKRGQERNYKQETIT